MSGARLCRGSPVYMSKNDEACSPMYFATFDRPKSHSRVEGVV